MNDEQNESFKKTKNLIGLFLLFLGVGIGLWVFINIYTIFNNPSRLTAFQALISDCLVSTLSAEPGENFKLIIPPEILAYFIPIVLLSILVGVAGALISGGVKLLDSDSQVLIRRFDRFRYQISTKLESFKESLNQFKNKNL